MGLRIPKSLYRYVCVGMFSNLTVYLIFLCLLWSGISPIWSAAICYGVGLLLSYVLNRRWSFESAASHGRDVPKFILSYAVGFIATLGFIAALVQYVPAEIAQIINIGLTAIVIYICLTLTRFGKGDGHIAD